jgi:hypothetical protein
MASRILKLTVATDNQKSSASFIPDNVKGILAHIPPLEAPGHTVTIEVYTGEPPSPADVTNPVLAASYDTNWVPIATTVSTGGNEVSVVPRDWPVGGNWVRFVVSGAQTVARTFRILFPERG